jgi:hypothetical protein
LRQEASGDFVDDLVPNTHVSSSCPGYILVGPRGESQVNFEEDGIITGNNLEEG